MSKYLTTKYPRGSEWNQWDLHVHTPLSIFHNYKNVKGDDNWELFIKDLEKLPPEFKVLGINDYLFIDGYKKLCIEKEKNRRLKNIKMLLPVIEFRLKKFCGTKSSLSRINFHIIFSPEIKPEIIQQHFLNAIPRHYQLSSKHSKLKNEWTALATRESLEDLGRQIKASVPPDKLKDYGSDLQEGFNNINFDEDQILEVLENSHYFRGKYLTAIGKTEWAEIKWGNSSIADKKDLINKVHFVFISSETIALYEKSKNELTNSKVNDLLLDCSDAHNFSDSANKDRVGNCYTWIKADPTFEGLKQVLREPGDRIFIGINPPKLIEVEDNKSKYIDSIKINPINFTNSPGWFNDELLINNGLVAVIGRKGSGKSAFTDIVSLCGNCKIDKKDYSFLCENKFCKPGLAEKFEATLKWMDGQANEKVRLNSEIDTHTEVEKIKYLPQQYVEKICGEAGISHLFQQEIEKVIFAYIPEENRIGAHSIEELIKIKTQALETKISILRDQLNIKNKSIVLLENKKRKEFLIKLTNKLNEKKRELKALKKPETVLKPKSNFSESDQVRLKKIDKKIEELETKILKSKNSLKDINNKIFKIDNIGNVLRQLQDRYDETLKDLEKDAEALSINLPNLVKFVIDDTILSEKKRKLIKEKENLERILEQNNDSSEISLYLKKEKLKIEKEKITNSFTTEQKKYEVYLETMRQLKVRKAEIMGTNDEDSLDTIKSIQKEIRYVEKFLMRDLDSQKKARLEILKNIFNGLIEKIEFLKEIYNPLIAFIEKEKEAQGNSENMLNFDVGIIFVKQIFSDIFFSYINRQRKGNFQGIGEGERFLNTIISKYDFKFEKSIIDFIEDIMFHIEQKNDLRSQLNKNTDEENINFYDFIFGLKYIDVKFKILFNEKDLNGNELSPGEKGALLLIFYLLIDKDKIPLVIDQPEENLDNESVYKLLVPYIKRSKQKRQIIIVTHNPNLAVVCDAEQIIYAQMDKKINTIRYFSGSIENPKINKKIVNVLEGTLPAFELRGDKYIKHFK